jgi:hypothetical protein
MRILCHRGFWKARIEQNRPASFVHAYRSGFGAETEVRDCNGVLVVSEGPASSESPTLEDIVIVYKNHGAGMPLALDVRADGLQPLISDLLRVHKSDDIFFFNLTVPEMDIYLSAGLNVFTRQSDIENEPALLRECKGVWLDTLRGDWGQHAEVEKALTAGKQVCLASPEIRKRPHEAFWNEVKTWRTVGSRDLMLCTDQPEEAKAFFGE